MFPAAPAQIIVRIIIKPNGLPCLIFFPIYHIMKLTATIRNKLSRSLLPISIPNAMPRFSIKSIRNQSNTTICSPSPILSLTANLMHWSITMSNTPNAMAIHAFFFTLKVGNMIFPRLNLTYMSLPFQQKLEWKGSRLMILVIEFRLHAQCCMRHDTQSFFGNKLPRYTVYTIRFVVNSYKCCLQTFNELLLA